jgi:hypothetical protein
VLASFIVFPLRRRARSGTGPPLVPVQRAEERGGAHHGHALGLGFVTESFHERHTGGDRRARLIRLARLVRRARLARQATG